MELAKRDSSGLILSFVDTTALAKDTRGVLLDELHEFVVEDKGREALAITEQGLEAQIEHLIARHGEDAVVEIVLRALDAIDKWRE